MSYINVAISLFYNPFPVLHAPSISTLIETFLTEQAIGFYNVACFGRFQLFLFAESLRITRYNKSLKRALTIIVLQ